MEEDTSTIAEATLLNKLKNSIRDTTKILDTTTYKYQDSIEAKQVKHEVTILLSELGVHGLLPDTGEQVISTSTVTLSISLTVEHISDVLCSALEGGSNYWYNIEEYITPPTWEFSSEPKRDNGFHWAQDYPLNPGGALMMSDKDDYGQGTVNRLDLVTIHKGLTVLAEKYPHHVADILMENADAGTGDAFLQCCLFGEIVYS